MFAWPSEICPGVIPRNAIAAVLPPTVTCEFARGLDENFDTTEVLLRSDLPEYRDRLSGREGDPMLAAELLIPVSLRQRAILRPELNRELGVWLTDAAYSTRTGLEVSPPKERDTIL